MPPLPIINNVQRVAMLWKFGTTGQTAVNVMHFSTASTDTLALKNLIDTNVAAAMWSQAPTLAQVVQLSITPLDGHTATQLYTVSGTKWAGTQAGAEFVPQAAVVVSLRTAERGRQNRGRLYLPFTAESYINSGVLATAPTTQQAAWDTFRANMKTGLMPMHVASYGHSLHKRKNQDGSLTYTPVTWAPHSNEVLTTAVESIAGTMRPRQARLR